VGKYRRRDRPDARSIKDYKRSNTRTQVKVDRLLNIALQSGETLQRRRPIKDLLQFSKIDGADRPLMIQQSKTFKT
jgi:hypothetical protein